MHHFTNHEIALTLSIAIIALCLAFLGGFFIGIWSTPKLPARPVYMIKGMYDSYSAVQAEINACKGKEDLRDAYLSIFAFEALYSDSPSFTSELYEKYEVKRKELMKEKEILSNA